MKNFIFLLINCLKSKSLPSCKYFRSLKILSVLLLTIHFVLSFEFCIAQISRTQIINNATPYTSFSWTASSCNLWSGTSCGGRNVYSADIPWVNIGTNISMPYCWGGWSTQSEHITAMTNCKSAGDICSSLGGGCSGGGAGLSCASGHDCSGLVSRAWGLSSKQSTSTLPSLSTSIPLNQVQPGDILNVAGSHTRLIETNYGNGNYRVIEASGTDWKTAYHTYTAAQLASYDPRCPNSSIVTGGCGSVATPSNDNCSSAITLTPNATCSSTSGDIAGATQSYAASGCPSGLIQDVWYKFTATSNGTYTITLDPSNSMDGVVEVRQGSCTGTVLGCADSGGGNGAIEKLNVTVTSGTTYYIRVYEYNTSGNTTPPATTDFTICVTGGSSSGSDDFYIQNVSVSPTSIAAGGTVEVSCDQCYSGSVLDDDMGTVYVGYYLSTNTSFSSSTDIELGTDGSGLGSDDLCDSESETLNIPSGTSAGTYYILFVSDYDGQFDESNENNNVAYIQITVTEESSGSDDFYIQNVSVSPASVSAGGTVDVSCDQCYSGSKTDASMGSVYVGYCLSTDINFNPSTDVELGNDGSGLGSDDPCNSESETLTIPSGTTGGTYYILFVTDLLEEFDENNESNNVSYVQINVTGGSSDCSVTSIVPDSETHGPTSFSTTPGADDIIVNAQPNCTFSVTESCSWLTITPLSGTTNGVGQAFLNYTIQENTSTSPRSCTVDVNGSTFTIIQNGCTYDFYPATKSVSATGVTYNLDINTDSPCSWSIQNDCNWVHLGSAEGINESTISVTIDPNLTGATRNCILTINPGNATHAISQSGSCTTPGIPASASGVVTGTTTADLSWLAGNPAGSSTVTYYWVVGTSSSVTYESGYTKRGTSEGTTASVTGLTAGTKYYLRVYAKTDCDGSQSGYKTSSSFTTNESCTTPGIPASASGVVTGTTTANLSWSAGNPAGSSTVTYYWVVGTSSSVTYESGYTKRGTSEGTTASVTGLTAGTKYYLRVYAKTDCDGTQSGYKTSSSFTTDVSCATPGTPSIGPITQPTCNVSTGSVFLYNLPSSGTWILKASPGGMTTTGNGTGTTIANLPAGTYSFTVTNAAGCTSSASGNVVINAVEIPPIPIITFLNDTTLHSDATIGNQWYSQNGIINGATNQNYIPVTSGGYYVIVTNQDGCESEPSDVMQVTITMVANGFSIDNLKIYPNPTSGVLTIEGLPEGKKTDIALYDMNSKLIKEYTSYSSITQMDISDVVSGSYVLIMNKQIEKTVKIIKE